MDMYDALILGGGPAGISAWLTARNRGMNALMITNPWRESPLARAESIDNYPGFAGVSGAELLAGMYAAAEGLGLAPVTGRAVGAMASGGMFGVSVGQDVYMGRSLILATGAPRAAAFPGEEEYLGRGVSYCATCDGMLYRGKPVAVIALAPGADEEADFLEGIGCDVARFHAGKYEIRGEGRVTALLHDGREHPCEGVFILRDTISAASLLPGLETERGSIKVGNIMSTNLPGVFACGDCAGIPYQITKAVGDGTIAAMSASSYVNKIK